MDELNTNQNLNPIQPPKANLLDTFKKPLFWASIVVLAAILSVVCLFTKGGVKPATNIKAQEKIILSNQFTLKFPQIASSSPITTFPENLKVLIPKEAQGVNFFKVQYVGGKDGYSAEFSLETSLIGGQNLQKYMSGFVNNKEKWQFLGGSYATSFAFIEIYNVSYRARVTENYEMEGSSQIKIEIIDNN